MNAHNEQHDSASPVVKQNLTTQPAAAPEAVAEITGINGRNGVEIHWLEGPAKIGDLLYAAPVTAAPAVAYMIDGRTEQGLTFDKAAAETMAFANGGTVRALGFVGGTPAAPGIDMGVPGATLTIDGKTFTVDEVRAALLPGASPNGALNEQFGSAEGFKAHFAEFIKLGRRHVAALYNSPRDEISMTDTGCWIQYAMQLLQLDSPKGGSEAVSDAMIHAALRVQYARAGSLWTGSEANPDFTDMRHILSAAMHPQAGDAEVQP